METGNMSNPQQVGLAELYMRQLKLVLDIHFIGFSGITELDGIRRYLGKSPPKKERKFKAITLGSINRKIREA